MSSSALTFPVVGGLALIGTASVVFHSFSASSIGGSFLTKEQREGAYVQRVLSYTRDHGLSCIVAVKFAEGPAAVNAKLAEHAALTARLRANPLSLVPACNAPLLLADRDMLKTEIRRP